MNQVNPHKTGLVLGAFLAFWHICWSLLVALGLAQVLIDWIFKLHFIRPPYTVTGFNLGTAVILIVAVFVVGYVFGLVIGWIWNRLHRS